MPADIDSLRLAAMTAFAKLSVSMYAQAKAEYGTWFADRVRLSCSTGHQDTNIALACRFDLRRYRNALIYLLTYCRSVVDGLSDEVDVVCLLASSVDSTDTT